MPGKKKSKKLDPKLVAAKQRAEVQYITKRYKVPAKDVRAAVSKVGHSRARVYAYLRTQGYQINTKK